jgi:cytochrome c-type biogenesis protein CcmH/NrfF
MAEVQTRVPQWAHSILQKVIDYVRQEETRKQIQGFIIDPLLNHVMNRVFPYVILTCVLFVLLLIVILVTLGIIVMQMRSQAVSLMQPLQSQ